MTSHKEIPFLKSINNTSDITTEIIRRCEEQLQNDKEYIKLKSDGMDFKKVIPYGNPEDPCFQVNQVFKFINPNELNIHRRLATYFTEGRHYFKAKITEDKKEPCNMFTRHGLMKAMYMGKTPLAEMFQNYVFDLLDGLWKRHKAIIITEMKVTEKNLEEERNRRREAESTNLKNIYLKEVCMDNFESYDGNKTELSILRRHQLNEYFLYIVDWNFVNENCNKPDKINKLFKKSEKKEDLHFGIDINSDDERPEPKTKSATFNEILDEYDFSIISLIDLEKNENDEYYFYISKKETKSKQYNFICPIYLDKSKHYKLMISSFQKTPIKNMFNTTYDTIMSARNKTFIELHKVSLVKK
jgi:hypothetical protein